MFFFILSMLALFIVAFLIMVAIQLIRMERLIIECSDIAEISVKKMYKR